jgi:prepilin-type N-terminal cleavage/methylation domain-containing protein
MKMKKGLTLIELLIVMAILAILVVIFMMTLNPSALVEKANDAKRKKDINRIKVAFEEYYSDKECYPVASLISQLTDVNNCDGNIFSPWLSIWPCDPKGVPYQIVVDDTNPTCPKWFKVLTLLSNQKDNQIPSGWGVTITGALGGSSTTTTANFGVSSTNMNWYSLILPAKCRGGCMYKPPGVECNGTLRCVGSNCFVGMCEPECSVPSCGQ